MVHDHREQGAGAGAERKPEPELASALIDVVAQRCVKPNCRKRCRETREDCGDDEPQCTENCGEPLCADDCDDTPGEEVTPEPKAPNTGAGMLLDTATNPMLMAGVGIAILMATVLIGTAALPKRR